MDGPTPGIKAAKLRSWPGSVSFAVYFMLARNQAFNPQRFMKS